MTTTHGADSEVMTLERCERLLLQLLAGEELEEGEALKATDMLADWFVGGVLFQMWDEGKIELRWNVKAQDLELRLPS
jgi:hypothetical protein